MASPFVVNFACTPPTVRANGKQIKLNRLKKNASNLSVSKLRRMSKILADSVGMIPQAERRVQTSDLKLIKFILF